MLLDSVSKGWTIYSVKGRFDSSNFSLVSHEIDRAVGMSDLFFALDLSQTQFVSISAIQYISNLSKRLQDQQRALALICFSSKIKRNFEIFSNVGHIRFCDQVEDLDFMVEHSQVG